MGWTDGPAGVWKRFGRTSLRITEIALKSIGVSVALTFSAIITALMVFFCLVGMNALIGYDFDENILSFLWNYSSQSDWGWYYQHEGRLLMGYVGFVVGALVLFLSPYALCGVPVASAVATFHWLDRPFRRRRVGDGIWCANGVDDPACLGELSIDQLSRPSLGSPRVRLWLGRAARCSATALTITAYFLLLVVLKDIVLAVPVLVWIVLLVFGFAFVAMVVLGLILGFVLSYEVPVALMFRLLDGERPAQALAAAVYEVFKGKKNSPRR